MGLTVEKCLQAWTNSLKQMNARADIVFFGDSLTYYGDFASLFPNKVVCNLGLRGDTIQGLIDRLDQLIILKPHKVFLMTGINDIASSNLEIFEKKYNELIRSLIEKLPGVEIVVQGLLPVNNVDYKISCNNQQIIEGVSIIHKISSRYGLPFIDLFPLYAREGILPYEETSDGIHLLPDAYNKWQRILLTYSES